MTTETGYSFWQGASATLQFAAQAPQCGTACSMLTTEAALEASTLAGSASTFCRQQAHSKQPSTLGWT
jgi:hypothetical protein